MKLQLFAVIATLTAIAVPAQGESLTDLNQFLGTKKCSQCDLSNAGLVQADLTGADLAKANLSQANLKGADLQGAIASKTTYLVDW
jgi:uncharacterized protein YjbI with pentapeptide repeats